MSQSQEVPALEQLRRAVDGACDKLDELRGLIEEAVPYLYDLAGYCEACDGSGEIIHADDRTEACEHCAPLWALIRRMEPRRPAPAPAVEEAADDDVVF